VRGKIASGNDTEGKHQQQEWKRDSQLSILTPGEGGKTHPHGCAMRGSFRGQHGQMSASGNKCTGGTIQTSWLSALKIAAVTGSTCSVEKWLWEGSPVLLRAVSAL